MNDLNRLIHESARLVLVSSLYVVDEADFVYLANRTGFTSGKISSHMTKLEAAGYVDVAKGFVGKRPRTTTNSPRRAATHSSSTGPASRAYSTLPTRSRQHRPALTESHQMHETQRFRILRAPRWVAARPYEAARRRADTGHSSK